VKSGGLLNAFPDMPQKATSNPTSHTRAGDGKRKKKQPYPPHLREIRLTRYPHGESKEADLLGENSDCGKRRLQIRLPKPA